MLDSRLVLLKYYKWKVLNCNGLRSENFIKTNETPLLHSHQIKYGVDPLESSWNGGEPTDSKNKWATASAQHIKRRRMNLLCLRMPFMLFCFQIDFRIRFTWVHWTFFAFNVQWAYKTVKQR